MNDYDILHNLENELRKLIEDELSKISAQWWKQRIPEDVRDKAEIRKTKDEKRGFQQTDNYPFISYVDFTDYEKIIIRNDNWNDTFKDIFKDENATSVKLKELEPIRRAIGHSRKLSKEDKKRLRFYSEEILSAIKYYKNQISVKKIQKEISQITVSSDRTVYPLDSTVHVRVNAPEIIKGELIHIGVYDDKGKLLVKREIVPDSDPEQKTAGIYEIGYEMIGTDWKIGNSYVVRARHGNSEAEDAYTIDQRMPVIQTDKSVYMINSDMIVTVIDPDSDKDSQSVEYVGDREDSKLIIESKYGKIDGYKLRETGDSTAIFQGIVGVLGIRKDGSVIERKIDGQIINKIQGIGIEDGFIGGSLGDEIKITYTSRSGTSSVVVFVSNFGAIVELDKKVYKATDKVYIIIVAPDLNYDLDEINEIGHNTESMIRIRTSEDEVLNYKLVETGPDTGIFTGEISLTESLEKSSSRSQSKLFGPNDGRIACNKDDFIEVALSYFGEEEIVGRALIKP